MQNFAARLVINTKKFDHVIPVLRKLQWPQVKSKQDVRDVTLWDKIILYKIIWLSDYLIIYPVRSSKGRMDIVNRDQLQCYLPSVELLLFRVPFFIVQ